MAKLKKADASPLPTGKRKRVTFNISCELDDVIEAICNRSGVPKNKAAEEGMRAWCLQQDSILEQAIQSLQATRIKLKELKSPKLPANTP